MDIFTLWDGKRIWFGGMARIFPHPKWRMFSNPFQKYLMRRLSVFLMRIRERKQKAYVIFKPEENADSISFQELNAYCLERLARFKVPRYFEYTKSFPRTPTERVEKHKLLFLKRDPPSGCYDGEGKCWRE
jgi:acyl-CoA synthetase (AMP-forming)/AMP-acid ligase II